jgi:hypothetical protein
VTRPRHSLHCSSGFLFSKTEAASPRNHYFMRCDDQTGRAPGNHFSTAGGTLGLGAALATRRLMANTLYKVPPDDPGTFLCGLGSFSYGSLGPGCDSEIRSNGTASSVAALSSTDSAASAGMALGGRVAYQRNGERKRRHRRRPRQSPMQRSRRPTSHRTREVDSHSLLLSPTCRPLDAYRLHSLPRTSGQFAQYRLPDAANQNV